MAISAKAKCGKPNTKSDNPKPNPSQVENTTDTHSSCTLVERLIAFHCNSFFDPFINTLNNLANEDNASKERMIEINY